MADKEESEVQEGNGLDPASVAEEYSASQGDTPSETEETSDLDEDEGESDPEPAPANATDDDDNDETFLTQNKGRNIPYSAFQKKYQKWKERESKAVQEAKKWQSEFESYRKSTQTTPEQLAAYNRLTQIFGNLDRASADKPWLLETLLALGQGKEPDWRAVNQALSQHVEALPQVDPVLARQVQELTERQQMFEQERFSSSIRDHVARENNEIRKILGDDQTAWKMLNQIAAESVPETGNVSNLPNRVELAKQILAWSESRAQQALKARVPAKAAARAGINAGRGPAGRSEANGDPPEPGTEEYRRWAAGL